MNETLDWLGSFFVPTWGARALFVTLIFGALSLIPERIKSAAPVASWMLRVALVTFILFVVMAIFFVLAN